MTFMKYYRPFLKSNKGTKRWSFEERNPEVHAGDVCEVWEHFYVANGEFWGYRFVWTEMHLKGHQLDVLRGSFDQLADACVEVLLQMQLPGEDLYATLTREAKVRKEGAIYQFWTQIHEIPDWADFEQIERGQSVFYRYGGAALTGGSDEGEN